MGGFEFGSVAHLDVQVTLISFISVILFIVVFDVGTGIMEYFLEGSKLYGKMIQMIYKELMLMGLVSFIVIITEAAQTTKLSHSAEGQAWFKAVDFSHILLFFVTFFFVAHAFYLMRASIVSGRKYKFDFAERITELIESIETVKKSRFQSYLYNFDFLPLSSVRDRVEFRLLHILFRDAYCLPEDFNFAYYLNGCYDRHALKTINRSFATWAILILLAVLNFIRISADIGFRSCTAEYEKEKDAAAAHNETSTQDHYDDHTEAPHRLLTDIYSLSSSGASHSSGGNHHGYTSNLCRINLVKLFLGAGILLCLYSLIIVFFSRLYKLR
jgi:hypothetical protein